MGKLETIVLFVYVEKLFEDGDIDHSRRQQLEGLDLQVVNFDNR